MGIGVSPNASYSTSTTWRTPSLCAKRLRGSQPANVGTGIEMGVRDLADPPARGLRGRDQVEHLAAGRTAVALPRCFSRARRIGFDGEIALEEGLERTVERLPGAGTTRSRDGLAGASGRANPLRYCRRPTGDLRRSPIAPISSTVVAQSGRPLAASGRVA